MSMCMKPMGAWADSGVHGYEAYGGAWAGPGVHGYGAYGGELALGSMGIEPMGVGWLSCSWVWSLWGMD